MQARIQENGNTYSLMLGVQIATVSMGITAEVSQKIETRSTKILIYTTLWNVPNDAIYELKITFLPMSCTAFNYVIGF